MRLTQIRDFLAVVEAGSIRGASRNLGVAQPTITKSVRSLEAELHVQLLVRHARGIVPTPYGRAFFARARVAHSELRKAEEEAAQISASCAGTVVFGMGSVGTVLILPRAVAIFLQEFPHGRVRVVEGLAHVLLPAVRDERLDFAFGVRPVTALDRTLKFRPLYRSQLVVAARKRHPLGTVRSLAKLITADWLTTISLGLPGGPLAQLFTSAGLTPPQPAIQCESHNALVALLAKTDMVALMQRRMLTEPFARHFLQEIPIEEPVPSVSAGLFTRSDAPLTRAAAGMAKAVTAVARQLARSVS